VNLTSPLPIGKEIRHCKGGGLGETIVEGEDRRNFLSLHAPEETEIKRRKGTSSFGTFVTDIISF
jgi:hypothetical protein